MGAVTSQVRTKVEQMRDRANLKLMLYQLFLMLVGVAERLRNLPRTLAPRKGAGLAAANRAQAGPVNQLVVIGAVLFIGVFVLSQIGSAMPENTGMFNGTMDQVQTVLSSSIELAAILPLVIIAGGLLFYVRRFGGNGGGGRR